MLLSSLAVEQHGVDDARRMGLAAEALAVARATQDPVALGHVLTRGWASLEVTGPCQAEFGRLNVEAEEVAEANGDLNALRDVNVFAMAMAAMVGDRGEAEARLAATILGPGPSARCPGPGPVEGGPAGGVQGSADRRRAAHRRGHGARR